MNFLVTGTPGVGKTLFAGHLQQRLAAEGQTFEVLNVSQLVKDERLYEEYDDVLDTIVMNDSKVKKRLKQILADETKNYIVECHSVSTVPKKLIEHTFVLRVPSTTIYYDRLAARNYPKAKINENVDCEIMQVVWMEAVDYFGPENVTVLISEAQEDLQEALAEALETIKELE